ncbi:MAG: peptidase S55 SpoIVB [Pelosinus sp.]|nr:peptidase S55 SpoIVB [Pelosinus sp.]
MYWSLRILKWFQIVLVVTFVPLAAYAAPDMMSVDNIKIGMHGIAKTVVLGTKIEDFDVEVLGIMKNQGPAGDLILVRVSGDVIDRTDGIVQGMSGSPVYIDGKLVGAIAYGWPLKDHKITMVTPIGDMLKLWNIPGASAGSSESQPLSTAPNQGDAQAVPEAASLMVSGLSEHAMDMLANQLKPYQLVPYAIGEAPAGIEFPPLEPGSSVGVQLVRGDVSMEAIGTVTYMEGNKILAFGHPFLKRGKAEYFMTNAYIFTTVNGLDTGFKLGTTGNLVGVINQDRGSGIAGEVASYPAIIPMSIHVQDKNLENTREANVQLVRDEQLVPALAATTVFSVMEKAMDRVGPGTAKVSFAISARNMPGEVLKRENLFYSAGNVGEAAVGEFLEAMSILMGNKYNQVDIMDVKVNVSVSDEQRTASIVEARASETTVRPGDKVSVTVQLKPFRGEKITRVVNFTVPKDQPAGPMTLEVRGGGMIPLAQLLKAANPEALTQLLKYQHKDKTFAEVISGFSNRERNNDIIVEKMDMQLLDTLPQDTKKAPVKEGGLEPEQDLAVNTPQSKAAVGSKAKDKKSEKAFISTDFIVDNDTQLIINVVKDSKE